MIMITKHKFVILAFVLTLGSQAPAVNIYGGHEASPHSRPYMVILKRHFEDQTGPKYCDGFLLNEDFVMTAAHCQASAYTVWLGVHNVQKIEQYRSVQQAFPHKDYIRTQDTVENDIMLLKFVPETPVQIIGLNKTISMKSALSGLSKKAILNQHVSAIGLPGPGDRTQPHVCLVSGWGRSDKKKNTGSTKLMEVNVTLTMDWAEEHLYCSEGEKGPGQGDSGGPLVCEDGLAHGVVSFTMEIPHKPTNQLIHAFTKIADYNDWIYEILGNHLRYNSK